MTWELPLHLRILVAMVMLVTLTTAFLHHRSQDFH